MKIETPQILWHNGADNDNGKNAPLYSVSMLESGFCQDSLTTYGHVLATCGCSSEINLWKLSFSDTTTTATSSSSLSSTTKRILQSKPLTKIEHLLSLTRHERSVNAIAFSPDGLHLATAGDSSSILIWSVPPSKRGNANGKHFWSSVTKEGDLTFRLVSTPCEGICDLSWSPDSKRLVVGSIDHCVQIYEDVSYDANNRHHHHQTTTTTNNNAAAAPPDNNHWQQQQQQQTDSQWRPIYRNTRDHTHFVQGVTFDPLGVYVASMGSDRTVRVYGRKPPSKAKKKVHRSAAADDHGPLPPLEYQTLVEQVLRDSKFELGKAKTLKYREVSFTISNDADDCTAVEPPPSKVKKQHLFADESTVESFFRRLSWTTDGAFLVTPAGLWHQENDKENSESSSPSFACFLFARHKFDAPYKVLSGLEKPSVAVRPSPVLYELPESATTANGPSATSCLPYRSIFAVLTQDSVLIYDTHHDRPLCIARGLHYAGLTDCTWSADGRQLVVSSTDGYLSILRFDENEFGRVYIPPRAEMTASPDLTETAMSSTTMEEATANKVVVRAPPASTSGGTRIAPCEPGQTATIEGRPAKRAKTRITPTLISAPSQTVNMTTTTTTEEEAKTAKSDEPSSKPVTKKRIQPTLVSTTTAVTGEECSGGQD